MKRLESFLNTMVAAEDADAVWRETISFFEKFGFDRLIHADLTRDGVKLRSTMPQTWQDRYQEQGYGAIDPFFVYCCATTQSVPIGRAHHADYAYLQPRQVRMIEEAAQVGLNAAFSVTFKLYGRDGAGGWNIGSGYDRASFAKVIREHGNTLRMSALYAHERLRHLTVNQASVVPLSAQQRECLLWAARGLRSQQIADRLNLKTVSVELYLRNARKKLGAQTREHAVAIAIQRGQIVP
ncbi:hypothetical protein VW29_02240 [Devosia limi DSM 17137]|uniref:Regulatory protein, luxR family n=1 Tax=Devosia limi DSM 17137 TaxID=1121477 RepID=A0A0F5LVU3_9HYPH|nr:LuxR family transcriptional regulator [Devosia limi]KKB86406.1 hypothetical protein VW29_02240 [Devosia limi DSM 17137]SHE90077.1 regulatory protein, luxR family [Devosia limi DSM 17137]